jgi:hypothetical protein
LIIESNKSDGNRKTKNERHVGKKKYIVRMEKTITKELMKLKKDLYRKKEEIREIKKLVNKEINGDLPSNVSDSSERELRTLLDEHFSILEKSVDPLPDTTSLTSHRKIIGKPIIWIKRIFLKMTHVYAFLILDKQKTFNQKSVALFRALILHQRMSQKKISHIEKRISECEVHIAVISSKLTELQANLEQDKNQASSHKPPYENK